LPSVFPAKTKVPDTDHEPIARAGTLIAAAVAAAAVLLGGMAWNLLTSSPSIVYGQALAPPSFVGSETCAGCHQSEAQLWHSSQHKHAMDHATEKSVLGDFSDATFDYYGSRSRFFRNNGKFFVETDGADGKLATFEVKYTFGIDPLQQYLVEFADGRVQALPFAWDTRPKGKGGQRWFHLYPNEPIRHDDILHWTRLNQNWNFMCSECHSTGVRKNYDAAGDRFATTWSEISVGCETCHGQGSNHVKWALAEKSRQPTSKSEDTDKGLLVRFDERSGIAWRRDPVSGDPQRSVAPAILRKEVETCGLCHARRGQFSEDWIPGHWLSDTHAVSPLTRGLYHADGQMLDEVYNYGSFKQSRMFAAGVTCSDCHDPHSAKPRLEGDGLCLQCHSSEKYAAQSHKHHEGLSPALECSSCHMPMHTYMVVDQRHDHSFRVPRPDLSVKFGIPNACNDCHTDRSAEWTALAVERWFGPQRIGFQDYADAFHAAWTENADAAKLLATVVANQGSPAFARASALKELASYVSSGNIGLAQSGLNDPDPMVRIGALDMLENVPPAIVWPIASPLLSDPSRGVRIRAVSLLAAVPPANQPSGDRAQFDRAAGEFIAAQQLNADRPESRAALGNFYARRGLTSQAEAEYNAALRLSPEFTPAAINLADLYRSLGQDSEGERVLRSAVGVSPRDAAAHHAFGLALVRQKRLSEALAELRLAAELEPGQARYVYVYAVGLNSAGRPKEAMAVLGENLRQHPNDRDTLLALIGFSRDAGDVTAALGFAERLSQLMPGDPQISRLLDILRQEATAPGAQ
jgi:predicted CXXCH cytochrome family protein